MMIMIALLFYKNTLLDKAGREFFQVEHKKKSPGGLFSLCETPLGKNRGLSK